MEGYVYFCHEKVSEHITRIFEGGTPGQGVCFYLVEGENKIALLDTAAYAASGALTDLFRLKAIVLAVILYFAMKKINLHPIVFLAASAVVGILLRFAGA